MSRTNHILVFGTRATKRRFAADIARALAVPHESLRWVEASHRSLAPDAVAERVEREVARASRPFDAVLALVPARADEHSVDATEIDDPSLRHPIAVTGVPLGIVPYRDAADLTAWIHAAMRARRAPGRSVVAAMQKPLYVSWSRRIARALRSVRPRDSVEVSLPNTTSNEELARTLARGFRLCVYAGHGRSRGWSGFRGVRFEHLEQAARRTRTPGAGGVVLSLSCGTLARERDSVTPFGLAWIRSGRLASFVGVSGAVEIEPLARITTDLLDARASRRHRRLSDLVREVDARVRATDDDRLGRAWRSFRLLGNPLAAV